MALIKQLLKNKGAEVWSTSPADTVYEALVKLAEKNVGALVVLDEGKLAGIISERDYARKVVLLGRGSLKTEVREIMTSEVITIAPNESVNQAMSLMTEHKIRHLPVVDEDQVVGVISIGDLVKSIIAEQKFTIDQLENYIAGGQPAI
ncbi:MAG: CBS domain-containing protein [Ardenticatenaceae bacterium]|nr:CBS domain-containing protein [Ardenticatenaceae bacterium]